MGRQIFLKQNTKSISIKKRLINSIKLKVRTSFHEMIPLRMNMHTISQEKIFAIKVSYTGLMYKIKRTPARKTDNPIFKMG